MTSIEGAGARVAPTNWPTNDIPRGASVPPGGWFVAYRTPEEAR